MTTTDPLDLSTETTAHLAAQRALKPLDPPVGRSGREFEALRAPFPEASISYLPKSLCKDCTKGICKEPSHRRQRCTRQDPNGVGPKGCGAYLGPHLHIPYVGHAEVTDRLLAVDPEWVWEPIAWAADGGPALRTNGTQLELWGRMTVLGVTRIEVGTVGANDFEAPKQAVSDFIKRAAMRFGVALDLWAKSDLAVEPKPVDDTGGFALDFIDEVEVNALRQAFKIIPDREQRKVVAGEWANGLGHDVTQTQKHRFRDVLASAVAAATAAVDKPGEGSKVDQARQAAKGLAVSDIGAWATANLDGVGGWKGRPKDQALIIVAEAAKLDLVTLTDRIDTRKVLVAFVHAHKDGTLADLAQCPDGDLRALVHELTGAATVDEAVAHAVEWDR